MPTHTEAARLKKHMTAADSFLTGAGSLIGNGTEPAAADQHAEPGAHSPGQGSQPALSRSMSSPFLGGADTQPAPDLRARHHDSVESMPNLAGMGLEADAEAAAEPAEVPQVLCSSVILLAAPYCCPAATWTF